MLPEHLGAALDETLRRVALENTLTEDIKAGPKRRSSATSKKGVPSISSRSRRSRFKPERKYQVCSVCKATVRVERIERHVTRAHNRPLAQAANNLDATPTRSATNRPGATTQPSNPVVIGEANRNESCPLCGASIRIGGIKKHMTKAHTSSLANPLFTEAVRQGNLARQRAHGTLPLRHHISPSLQKTTRCPICKVAIKASRFEKHMRKVHRKRVVVRSAKDAMRQSTTLLTPRDKNLDATKPYAHAYREQGKFGSHPSHDGFDDESSPD
jgi:hypothetical protein